MDESKFYNDNFCSGFYELWPKHVEDEVTRLNKTIHKSHIKKRNHIKKLSEEKKVSILSFMPY